jgi:hypothetical protein
MTGVVRIVMKLVVLCKAVDLLNRQETVSFCKKA